MNYYFHVPFCRSKCAYCAFYSEPSPAEIPAYLKTLRRQLEQTDAYPVAETIYFGGGTPTLLDEARLEEFFTAVFHRIPVAPGAEISIEANPETLTPSKVSLLRHYCTRISLGVQSFHAAQRKRLGRNCSDTAIRNALSVIRDAKFPHFNCDLIYAVSGQTIADWKQDLEYAFRSGIDHLSCYNLTAEENSRLGSATPVDEFHALEMYRLAEETAKANGIFRYEISNYSRPGAQCRHNVNVWRGGLLTAFGPSAASFDGLDRRTESASLQAWLNDVPPELDRISPEQRRNEIFAVNLRTVSGWTPEQWNAVPHADQWGDRLAIANRRLRQFGENMVCIHPEQIRLTAEGLLFWNDIAEALL